jgi:N-acetylglucosaminyl-diphospho-decaprenol L-rhamnosyltransferase
MAAIWGRHFRSDVMRQGALLSYCVVNTNGREDLMACLDAIERTHPAGVEHEILVLDNASEDGSAEAVRKWAEGEDLDAVGMAARHDAGSGDGRAVRLIALEHRAGKAANDSLLLQEAQGRYCLLLNEDSELRPGAVEALIAALDADPRAGAGGAQLLDSDGNPVPCAWRFPGVGTALAGALFLHKWLTVQSKTGAASATGGAGAGGAAGGVKHVDWAQSSALIVRREAAAEVDYLDPGFFVYYDECDFCKRLADAGWHTLFVPAAEAVHHDQLSTDLAAGLPRIVEFHRNRDLYMRKHHGHAAAFAVRVLTAWSYAVRAAAALLTPNRSPRIMWAHTRQALLPDRGRGIRDSA